MNDIQEITKTIESYFQSTYRGNSDELRKIFHSNAYITGNINGQFVDWPLDDFIARAITKPTAAEKKDPYDKQIISIDQTVNVAMVKARVVIAGLIFTDYMTLLKIEGKWLIRNKSFTT